MKKTTTAVHLGRRQQPACAVPRLPPNKAPCGAVPAAPDDLGVHESSNGGAAASRSPRLPAPFTFDRPLVWPVLSCPPAVVAGSMMVTTTPPPLRPLPLLVKLPRDRRAALLMRHTVCITRPAGGLAERAWAAALAAASAGTAAASATAAKRVCPWGPGLLAPLRGLSLGPNAVPGRWKLRSAGDTALGVVPGLLSMPARDAKPRGVSPEGLGATPPARGLRSWQPRLLPPPLPPPRLAGAVRIGGGGCRGDGGAATTVALNWERPAKRGEVPLLGCPDPAGWPPSCRPTRRSLAAAASASAAAYAAPSAAVREGPEEAGAEGFADGRGPPTPMPPTLWTRAAGYKVSA
jgi:hypothetical protein